MKFFSRGKKGADFRGSEKDRRFRDVARDARPETIHLRKRDVRVRVDLSGRDAVRQLWRFRYPFLALAGIVVIILGTNRLFLTQASIAELHASACLGGWQNSDRAAGVPEVALEDASAFTEANSAILPGGTASELFCGAFQGDIPDGTSPKKLVLNLSWTLKQTPAEENPAADVPAPLASEDPLPTSTDTGASDGTEPAASSSPDGDEAATAPPPEEATAPGPAAAPESEPVIDAPAVGTVEPEAASFFRVLHAFAADEEAVPVPDVPAEVPVEGDATSTISEPASAEPVVQNGDDFLEIVYTLDGVSWLDLARVNNANWHSLVLEIPTEGIADWDAVSKIQIGLRSLSSTGDTPTIYLDAVILEVEYEEVVPSSLEENASSTDATATSTPEAAPSGPFNIATTTGESGMGFQISGAAPGSMIGIYFLDDPDTAPHSSYVYGAVVGDDGITLLEIVAPQAGRFTLVNTMAPDACAGIYLEDCRETPDYLGEETVTVDTAGQ
jgi:hypothetical protein